MNPQKIIIACSSLRQELDRLLNPSTSAEIVYLDQDLHFTPHLLPEAIQHSVNQASKKASEIVIAYGLCSNAIVGVRAPHQGIAVTKAHDCIALFLGSVKRYYDLFKSHPGSYYLLPGWIDLGKDPLGIMHRQYIPRMGQEMAEWGMKEELKQYKNFIFINTHPENEELYRLRSKENASFFHKNYLEIEGDLSYFKRIVYGPYDKDWFYLLGPEESIKQDWFL